MTVISTEKNADDLTLTVIAQFDANAERVWQIWADPRQLERWWGPPTWPATFSRHEFEVGGQVRYYMTGPEGDKAHGWWTITAIAAPRRLELDDGFADANGEPLDLADVTHMTMTLQPDDGGTRMTLVTSFRDIDQLEKMAQMGMEEGMRQAIGQVDDILSA
ncbi:MAG: SRPBCC family protein [Candidatus Nanopelagicales bacterium]